MNIFRTFLCAAIGCALWTAPVSAGPDGKLGMALMSAVVDSNGSLARGTGVISTFKLGGIGSGTYSVSFDRNITSCTYNINIGSI
jgi:hypothetical protein